MPHGAWQRIDVCYFLFLRGLFVHLLHLLSRQSQMSFDLFLSSKRVAAGIALIFVPSNVTRCMVISPSALSMPTTLKQVF